MVGNINFRKEYYIITNSPIPRIGGKCLLRKAICERFPETSKFDRYIEVFGGAAWVLFYKEKHAALEVYNDGDGDLVNLMRCIKYHRGELQREIDGFYNSCEMFFDALEQLHCRGFTDIQRAARYFIKIRLSFGSAGREFGCNVKPLQKSADYLSKVSERLASVVIEHKNYDNLIKVYDRPTAFFYLDPPYCGTERMYDVSFTAEDHLNLKQHLSNIKGLFLLSYNDDPFIRDLYKDFHIEPVKRNNNMSTGNYKELLISNY